VFDMSILLNSFQDHTEHPHLTSKTASTAAAD
jgi:hypothetical protein